MKGKSLKVLALVLTMLFMVTVVGCGGSSNTGDKTSDGGEKKPIVIRIGTTVTPTHSYSVVAQDFEKEVEEKTNGEITFNISAAACWAENARWLKPFSAVTWR